MSPVEVLADSDDPWRVEVRSGTITVTAVVALDRRTRRWGWNVFVGAILHRWGIAADADTARTAATAAAARTVLLLRDGDHRQ